MHSSSGGSAVRGPKLYCYYSVMPWLNQRRPKSRPSKRRKLNGSTRPSRSHKLVEEESSYIHVICLFLKLTGDGIVEREMGKREYVRTTNLINGRWEQYLLLEIDFFL